jgi:hypothetical protein
VSGEPSDEDATYWREQATRCRRLAASITDEVSIAALQALADEFEAKAAKVGETQLLPHTRIGLPPRG